MVRNGKNVEFIVTMTDTLFQAKLKNMYPRFKQDANVGVTDERLIDDITGVRILFSTPWAKMNLVFSPLMLTNKAHGCLT